MKKQMATPPDPALVAILALRHAEKATLPTPHFKKPMHQPPCPPPRPPPRPPPPTSLHAFFIARNRAAATKRALIRQAMTRDGKPLATVPPPPPTPMPTEDEADAARYNREREAVKAQRRANALAALRADGAPADALAAVNHCMPTPDNN